MRIKRGKFAAEATKVFTNCEDIAQVQAANRKHRPHIKVGKDADADDDCRH